MKKIVLGLSLGAVAIGITSFFLKRNDNVSSVKENARHITVYKSPTCGCCTEWEAHLKQNGFDVDSRPTEDMDAIKREHHVGKNIASCHTAIIGDYVIEGHVPALDIVRLLTEKPQGVIGLSAPGMPGGSPGMENAPKENYNVISFNEEGEIATFASH